MVSDAFRFSPRPNRAAEIRWRPWSAETFDEAERTQTPMLLNLSAVWCASCREMDETTYSDDRIIALLNERFIPVRVDADRFPHIQDRYIMGGWPTNALLTPTGEVFWSGRFVDASELRRVAEGVLEAWRDRRDELRAEIERRRQAMESARSRRPSAGMVRRESADDVLTGAQDQFDARNGGFGAAPKFVHAEAIEFLYTQAERLPNPDWAVMAERTLDGMLAGELEDPVEGGFFHYALEADWTRPQVEKLLAINARLLAALAFGAARTGRPDWAAAAERTVAWVDATLGRPDGLWGGSQSADPAYFAADAAGRAALTAPPADGTAYTHACGLWITALVDAGDRLGRPAWVERAGTALDTLLAGAAAPDDNLVHYRVDASPADSPVTGLLLDLVHVARACSAVSRVTGRADALEHALRLVATMERTLWDDTGGFVDHEPGPRPLGALRYRDRPFEENALAARLLVDLARRTGDKSYRAMAERTLALLSPLAGRYGVEGATFALAIEEFFQLRRA